MRKVLLSAMAALSVLAAGAGPVAGASAAGAAGVVTVPQGLGLAASNTTLTSAFNL